MKRRPIPGPLSFRFEFRTFFLFSFFGKVSGGCLGTGNFGFLDFLEKIGKKEKKKRKEENEGNASAIIAHGNWRLGRELVGRDQ